MKDELFEQLLESVKKVDNIFKNEQEFNCTTQIKTGDESEVNDKTTKSRARTD